MNHAIAGQLQEREAQVADLAAQLEAATSSAGSGADAGARLALELAEARAALAARGGELDAAKAAFDARM